MSYADEIFKANMTSILKTGQSTEKQNNRPKWEDGSEAWTIQKFGICNTYDLRKEFPAITYRPTGLKLAMDEILWIYQKKSNNINDLNSHIWDSWADEKGSIGKAYGFQVRQIHTHLIKEFRKKFDNESIWHYDEIKKINIQEIKTELNSYCDKTKYVVYHLGDKFIIKLDQMDGVLYDLKNNPFSRRIIISLWNTKDLIEMRLQPCCWSINFMVTDEGYDKLVLNATLHQRSADMLTANNWNVSQYAILLMMVAQVSDMIPGQLTHMITNAHIYNRHIDLVKDLLTRETYPAPKVSLNPDIKNFYEFTTDDLKIENYQHGKQIKIPVAI